MTNLFLRDHPVESVFELIGSNENSLTYALGWCLREAPALLGTIAEALGVTPPQADQANVMLQEHRSELGFTDVEVRDPGRVAWIFEAKVGFAPPGLSQLTKYASRLNQRDDLTAQPLMIVLAQSDRNDMVLRRHVPPTVDCVPVIVLSWRQLLACCTAAAGAASSSGREALRQLQLFVRKVLLMRDRESNQVFVVSIGKSHHHPVGTTFQQVVTEHGRYFHPADKRWPNNPPNYLGFRWDGQLQSIHHVDDYKVVDNMIGEFPNAVDEELPTPYFLYTLGPAIRPAKPVRNGDSVVMANRLTAALDLLLTCETITEAWEKTKARQVVT